MILSRSGKILVVDDHVINRELIRNVLELEHEVFTAESVTDAQAILATEDIDLVLLDVMMPGTNGLEWLENLRQDTKSENLPVILVSALSDTHDIVRGLTLGANDYIAKPLDMRILKARVKTQLALKHLTDEREQTINKLKEAERLRSNLFRIVSHDLKNPLNNIRMAEYILREKSTNEADKAVFNTIRVTVDAMQQVIDDFLEMVELESSAKTISLQTTQVKDVIEDILAQYEITAQNKRISLDAVGDMNVSVIADYHRLRQVLGNLVSNALKYSPFDTCVTIKIMPLDATQDKPRLRISVVDQGPGVLPEERDHLFKEFATTSNRPTDNESSTGLGLWIVAHLMTLQGGSNGVEFPDSGGSVFWIELPQAPDDEGDDSGVLGA